MTASRRMGPGDMFSKEEPRAFPDDKILKDWPQTMGELVAYSKVLTERGLTVIADQIAMATFMANERYKGMPQGLSAR